MLNRPQKCSFCVSSLFLLITFSSSHNSNENCQSLSVVTIIWSYNQFKSDRMILSWILSAFGAINNVSDHLGPDSPQPKMNLSMIAGKKYDLYSRRPVVMLVEGNVGSGKSTFLDIMSSLPGVEVYQEPVDLWRNVGGVNLFEKMVKEPHRWTTAFQLFSSKTRFKYSSNLKSYKFSCKLI